MMLSKVRKIFPAVMLIVFLGMAVFATARAQEELESSAPAKPKDMVQAYFNRCVNSVFQDLAPETREAFCACTSTTITNALSQAQIETMATGKGKPVDKVLLAN